MQLVRCKTCLMPTTRPSTAFVDGECSACINFRNRANIDWAERGLKFRHMLGNIYPNSSGYHVVVPSSGGKDSTYQVLKMLELGVKPLVVTATTCQLTEIGRANISNLARFATTIEVTPNTAIRKKLNRAGLQLVGDISLPEHMAIFSIPFKIASDMGISTIIYGESPLREYGSPLGHEEQMTMTRRWVMEHGGLLGMRPDDFVGANGITAAHMADYTLPSEDKLNGINAYFLGQYFPWDSKGNADIATRNGMRCQRPCEASWWEGENQDNAQTGIHDHMMYRKFGYGRLCAQISVDIRNGRISREEAYAIVKDRDGLFPYGYMGVSVKDVCLHIGITFESLIDTMNRFTNWSLFDGQRDLRPILKEFAS